MRNRIAGAIAAASLVATAALAQTTAPQAVAHSPSNRAMESSSLHSTTAPSRGANSFTEGQARSRIARGGYAHISDLAKDDAGLWQGTAMKRGKKVHVSLDYKGNVSSN